MNLERTSLRSALKGEITCAVCQEIYDKPHALLPCLHTFCLDCVNFIPANNSERRIPCPICRKLSTGRAANFTIQSFIDILNDTNLKDDVSSPTALDDSDEGGVEVTRIIERIDINDTRPHYGLRRYTGESSSSYESLSSIRNVLVPCRSCRENNNTNYQCPVPITESSRDTYGHILCDFCYENMPARGKNGVEPAFDQCCSFCGLIACDAYWSCSSSDMLSKLSKLSDISYVATWLYYLESIRSKEEGHLNGQEIEDLKQFLRETGTSWDEAWSICLMNINENYFRTPLLTRMTPAAHEVYNTRRLPKYYDSTNSQGSDDEDDEDEDDDYFDQINEKGIMPSDHLRACTNCLPTIVNGQFYGYWKNALESGLADNTKEQCTDGIECEVQWRDANHARRYRHVELDPSTPPF